MSQNLIEENEIDLTDLHISLHYAVNKTFRMLLNEQISQNEITKEMALEEISSIKENLKKQECDYCHENGHNY